MSKKARALWQDIVWTQKDGTKVKIIEMEEDHLKHCIKMLEKTIKKAKQWIPILKAEQDRRKQLHPAINDISGEFMDFYENEPDGFGDQ